MKRQPLGILLFPLKKSMKEVVLFDTKQREKEVKAENTFSNWREKKTTTLVLRMNKVSKRMLKPHSKTLQ